MANSFLNYREPGKTAAQKEVKSLKDLYPDYHQEFPEKVDLTTGFGLERPEKVPLSSRPVQQPSTAVPREQVCVDTGRKAAFLGVREQPGTSLNRAQPEKSLDRNLLDKLVRERDNKVWIGRQTHKKTHICPGSKQEVSLPVSPEKVKHAWVSGPYIPTFAPVTKKTTHTDGNTQNALKLDGADTCSHKSEPVSYDPQSRWENSISSRWSNRGLLWPSDRPRKDVVPDQKDVSKVQQSDVGSTQKSPDDMMDSSIEGIQYIDGMKINQTDDLPDAELDVKPVPSHTPPCCELGANATEKDKIDFRLKKVAKLLSYGVRFTPKDLVKINFNKYWDEMQQKFVISKFCGPPKKKRAASKKISKDPLHMTIGSKKMKTLSVSVGPKPRLTGKQFASGSVLDGLTGYSSNHTSIQIPGKSGIPHQVEIQSGKGQGQYQGYGLIPAQCQPSRQMSEHCNNMPFWMKGFGKQSRNGDMQPQSALMQPQEVSMPSPSVHMQPHKVSKMKSQSLHMQPPGVSMKLQSIHKQQKAINMQSQEVIVQSQTTHMQSQSVTQPQPHSGTVQVQMHTPYNQAMETGRHH